MNAKEVVDKILAEAHAEADVIRDEVQSKVSEESARFDTQIRAFKEETESLCANAAEERKSRMLAAGRMEMKKAYAQVKGRLLDAVFEKARDLIMSLPDKEYGDFVGGLMVKAAKSGDEEVVIGKNETRITQHLIKTVNRQLGPGYKGNLRIASDRADIANGFILRRGKIQINVSTEVLIAQGREALEVELAAELFS